MDLRQDEHVECKAETGIAMSEEKVLPLAVDDGPHSTATNKKKRKRDDRSSLPPTEPLPVVAVRGPLDNWLIRLSPPCLTTSESPQVSLVTTTTSAAPETPEAEASSTQDEGRKNRIKRRERRALLARGTTTVQEDGRCIPSPAVLAKRQRALVGIECPLSLEPIPQHRAKRLRIQNHTHIYDIQYLLPAMEADPGMRDPCTRATYTPHQIASIRKLATAVGMRVASTAVLKTIHETTKRLDNLRMTLRYYQWTDIQKTLDAAVEDMEWFARSDWFSDTLRCEVAERWMEAEEKKCAESVQNRAQLSDLLQQEEDDFHEAIVRLYQQDHFFPLQEQVMLRRVPFDS